MMASSRLASTEECDADSHVAGSQEIAVPVPRVMTDPLLSVGLVRGHSIGSTAHVDFVERRRPEGTRCSRTRRLRRWLGACA
jgi:hypothetical protein